jgi:sulfate permease, SulP family
VRNSDLVCLERLEHFIRHSQSLGITVLLAGARPDLLDALHRLRFEEWYPEGQIFPQGNDEDSATLAAIRDVYEKLGDANPCNHCAPKKAFQGRAGRLYYLV